MTLKNPALVRLTQESGWTWHHVNTLTDTWNFLSRVSKLYLICKVVILKYTTSVVSPSCYDVTHKVPQLSQNAGQHHPIWQMSIWGWKVVVIRTIRNKQGSHSWNTAKTHHQLEMTANMTNIKIYILKKIRKAAFVSLRLRCYRCNFLTRFSSLHFLNIPVISWQ